MIDDQRDPSTFGAPSGRRREPRDLLPSLVRELFQTEQSAKTHPIVEAERLGDTPAARAMRAVSDHASAALAELPGLMRVRDLPVSAGGAAVGKTFSLLRDHLADLLLSCEQSYRGTLLGMRHGMDLVELIRDIAAIDGDQLLAAWCARWLGRRKPLVETAARELAWFAAHPEEAARPAKRGAAAYAVRALLGSITQAAELLGNLRSRVRELSGGAHGAHDAAR